MRNRLLIMTFLIATGLGAQVPKGQFFSFVHMGANFCQIDGDQASGYNKFGMTGSFMVGQGLGKGLVYETGIGYSIRGSRRPFNPDDPGMQSMNLHFSMIDVPVLLMKYQGKWSYGGGLITTILLKAEDKENYILHLQNDMRKLNMLGCINVTRNLSPRSRIYLQAQYSINSIRISNNLTNLYFRQGVFHNVISLGVDLLLSSGTKK